MLLRFTTHTVIKNVDMHANICAISVKQEQPHPSHDLCFSALSSATKPGKAGGGGGGGGGV